MGLDEKTLRKPGFIDGIKVTMADGNEWTLPRPKIRFKPRFVEGRVEVGGGPSFGPDFDEKLDILLVLRTRIPQSGSESSLSLRSTY